MATPLALCLLVIFSAFVVLYYSVGYMYRITEEMYIVRVLMGSPLTTSSITSRDSMTSYS